MINSTAFSRRLENILPAFREVFADCSDALAHGRKSGCL